MESVLERYPDFATRAGFVENEAFTALVLSPEFLEQLGRCVEWAKNAPKAPYISVSGRLCARIVAALTEKFTSPAALTAAALYLGIRSHKNGQRLELAIDKSWVVNECKRIEWLVAQRDRSRWVETTPLRPPGVPMRQI